MSDAPMTPSELAEKIADWVGPLDTLELDHLALRITDRDAAIRREAQAEALKQAASLEKNEMEAIRKMGGEHMEVELLKSKIRLSSILNLSPDPHYRERIVREAQAEALEQAADMISNYEVSARAIRALSPDPNYIPRIVAQAKMSQAQLMHDNIFEARIHTCDTYAFITCRLLDSCRADLARLAAADAPKEGK